MNICWNWLLCNVALKLCAVPAVNYLSKNKKQSIKCNSCQWLFMTCDIFSNLCYIHCKMRLIFNIYEKLCSGKTFSLIWQNNTKVRNSWNERTFFKWRITDTWISTHPSKWTSQRVLQHSIPFVILIYENSICGDIRQSKMEFNFRGRSM